MSVSESDSQPLFTDECTPMKERENNDENTVDTPAEDSPNSLIVEVEDEEESTATEEEVELIDGEEVTVVDLDKAAEKDEALWDDEHTSDSDEYDPAKEEESPEKEEVEYKCTRSAHEKCVKLAEKVDLILCEQCDTLSNRKQRLAALTEAICDHYKMIVE